MLFALGLLLCLFFWFGAAKQLKKDGKSWFVRNVIAGSGASFVFIVVIAVGVFISDDTNNTEQPTNAVAAPMATTDNQATFLFTAQQYTDRLNSILEELTLPYEAVLSDIAYGPKANSSTMTIGPYAAVSLSINKADGKLLSVTAIGAGDGSESSGVEIMMIGAAAQTATANGAAFREVLLAAPDMINGERKQFGQATLSISNMGDLGTWYLSEPQQH